MTALLQEHDTIIMMKPHHIVYLLKRLSTPTGLKFIVPQLTAMKDRRFQTLFVRVSLIFS